MQIQEVKKKQIKTKTSNLFFIRLGGVIAVALTLSHRRAMKELELSP